jgi:hypothetical protein
MSVYDLPFFTVGPTTGENGKDGKDGVSPNISVDNISGGYKLTITDESGSKAINILNGSNGKDGQDGTSGKDGLSATIASASATIDNTTGTPTVNITLGGTELERTIAFAFSGLKGETGSQGIQGERGIPGEKGDTGSPGIQGVQGEKGDTGERGPQGETGLNGKGAYEYAKDSGYTKTETEFAEMLANAIDKRTLALGLHTDGLLYLFIDGEPIGTGIVLTTNETV